LVILYFVENIYYLSVSVLLFLCWLISITFKLINNSTSLQRIPIIVRNCFVRLSEIGNKILFGSMYGLHCYFYFLIGRSPRWGQKLWTNNFLLKSVCQKSWECPLSRTTLPKNIWHCCRFTICLQLLD